MLSFFVFGLWAFIDALRIEARQGSMLSAALVAAASTMLSLLARRIGVWLGPQKV